MSEIAITAAIVDGSAMLFEAPAPDVLHLPRCAFGSEHEEIEDALAAHIKDRMGIQVTAQQFVDTVFERRSGSTETLVNNLQLVTAWEGVAPERDAAGRPLRWVPYAELAGLDLPPDLLAPLLGALGLQTAHEAATGDATARPGRIILLTGPDEDDVRRVAHQLPAALGRCGVVELATARGFIHPASDDTPDSPSFPVLMRRLRALSLQNAMLLAGNISGAGLDVVIAGETAGPEEVDAFVGGLLGMRLYLVQLAPPGWRRDTRGMQVETGGASAGEVAGQIADQLERGRLS